MLKYTKTCKSVQNISLNPCFPWAANTGGVAAQHKPLKALEDAGHIKYDGSSETQVDIFLLIIEYVEKG